MRYAITALLSLFFATGLQAQSFTVHEFSAGAGPMDNVRADFNRDGIADLANVNNHSSSVSVLLGNGDGTFRAPLQSAAGEAPVALAVVDLNNDRIPDLVTANQGPDADHSLSVLIGNGNGTFQTHRDFN